jgi:hypothetical protein
VVKQTVQAQRRYCLDRAQQNRRSQTVQSENKQEQTVVLTMEDENRSGELGVCTQLITAMCDCVRRTYQQDPVELRRVRSPSTAA